MSLSYQIYRQQNANLFPVRILNITEEFLDFQIENYDLQIGEKITFVFQGSCKPDLAVFGSVSHRSNPANCQFRATFTSNLSIEMTEFLHEEFLQKIVHILDTRK